MRAPADYGSSTPPPPPAYVPSTPGLATYTPPEMLGGGVLWQGTTLKFVPLTTEVPAATSSTPILSGIPTTTTPSPSPTPSSPTATPVAATPAPAPVFVAITPDQASSPRGVIMAGSQVFATVTQASPLKVVVDGATTDSPADTLNGATYLFNARVTVQIRNPQTPLVMG